MVLCKENQNQNKQRSTVINENIFDKLFFIFYFACERYMFQYVVLQCLDLGSGHWRFYGCSSLNKYFIVYIYMHMMNREGYPMITLI